MHYLITFANGKTTGAMCVLEKVIQDCLQGTGATYQPHEAPTFQNKRYHITNREDYTAMRLAAFEAQAEKIAQDAGPKRIVAKTVNDLFNVLEDCPLEGTWVVATGAEVDSITVSDEAGKAKVIIFNGDYK